MAKRIIAATAQPATQFEIVGSGKLDFRLSAFLLLKF
jgi:hypothetical protein